MRIMLMYTSTEIQIQVLNPKTNSATANVLYFFYKVSN